MSCFNDLPVELIQHIVSFLPDKDAYSAVCASPYITIPKCDLRRRHWLRCTIPQLAAGGDLEGVKYLHRIYKNNLYSLQYTSFGQQIDCVSLAMEWASTYGHLPVVQYLHDISQGTEQSIFGWLGALWNGHLPVIDFLHRIYGHTEVTSTTLGTICDNGHLAVVQYLYEHNIVAVGSNGRGPMDRAAWHGHLALVQYLHGLGESPTEDAIDSAAFEGHLAVVQFLHSVVAAPLTAEAIDGACYQGHYEVVQFLHTIGAPFTGDAIDIAQKNGHWAIVALLKGKGE
jgi:hypothetical protein